jgi:hypothetical protein
MEDEVKVVEEVKEDNTVELEQMGDIVDLLMDLDMLVGINASDEQIADVRKELFIKTKVALNNTKIYGDVRDIIWTIHNLYLHNEDMKYIYFARELAFFM